MLGNRILVLRIRYEMAAVMVVVVSVVSQSAPTSSHTRMTKRTLFCFASDLEGFKDKGLL
jgi:hypothetical protein